MAWNLGLLGAAIAVPPDFELISTTVLTSNTASVTFSSIPQDYKHLQIRYLVRGSNTATQAESMRITANSDTGANYSHHVLNANGSQLFPDGTANASFYQISGILISAGNTANAFAAGVTDVLDPFSTSKFTTFRTLGGFTGSISSLGISSGLYRDTAAINALTFVIAGGNIVTGSRFSLYGIRG